MIDNKKKYIKIYFDIAYNQNISVQNKILLADLIQMAKSGLMNNRWVSNVYLAERYKLSIHSIKKMVSQLKEDSYIYTHIERANDTVTKRDINIIFKTDDKRYIELPHDIAFNKNVNWLSKLIYAEINTQIKLHDICIFPEKYLCIRFNKTLPAIRKALDDLRKANLIYNETTCFGKEYKLSKKNIKKFK